MMQQRFLIKVIQSAFSREKKFFYAAIAFASFCLQVFPNYSLATISTLSDLVQKGQFSDAILEMQKNPSETAGYYYNLGTLHAKAGNLTLAYANLLKAQALDPLYKPAREQLERVENAFKSSDSSEYNFALSQSFLESYVENAERVVMGFGNFTPVVVALIFTASFILAGALIRSACYYFFYDDEKLNANRMARLPSLLLAATVLSFLLLPFAYHAILPKYQKAVVIQPALIKSGPDASYITLTTLRAPTVVKVLQKEEAPNGWYKIQFKEGQIGWTKNSSLLLL